MPTYGYLCQSCGHEFDQLQPITSDPLRKCPECSKPKLKRLIGAGSAVIFKGSGFYQTDYRSDSYNKARKNDKPPTDKPADKKDKTAKTESKTTTPDKTKTDKKKK